MRQPQTLSLRDKLYMQPIDKYLHYGRFPWKLLIHLLLVLLTSLQVVLILIPLNTYSISQMTLWNKLFLNPNADSDDTSLVFSFNIFSIKDLEDYILTVNQVYFNLNEYTVDEYTLHKQHGHIKPIEMTVQYLDYNDVDNGGYDYNYKLQLNDLGPFYSLSPKSYVDHIKRFQLSFEIKHKVASDLQLAVTCFEWQITQNYDYYCHGLFIVTMDAVVNNCSSDNSKR
jgi:hypothetical protein